MLFKNNEKEALKDVVEAQQTIQTDEDGGQCIAKMLRYE